MNASVLRRPIAREVHGVMQGAIDQVLYWGF